MVVLLGLIFIFLLLCFDFFKGDFVMVDSIVMFDYKCLLESD